MKIPHALSLSAVTVFASCKGSEKKECTPVQGIEVSGDPDPGLDIATAFPTPTTIDNPWLPWPVGATWTLEGSEDEDVIRDELEVLPDTYTVAYGVECIVVHDSVYANDELVEETFDWYAEDADGNVWYMGEDSREMEGGEVVSTEGSWESGVDGAFPGIAMQATPTDQAYRQEYKEGEAEDLALVTGPAGSVTVPTGTYTDTLGIEEWTPLEPCIREKKTYARGIGVVQEDDLVGGNEHTELTAVSGVP
jgi:hypothetical protein